MSSIAYPKDVHENLRFRLQLLTECEKDVRFARQMQELFKRDILIAFNLFFWAYDPRSPLKDRPIVTFPFQDKTILTINEGIERGENIFIDKSRDMLATYMVLLVYLWRFLTKRSEEFKIGSRKEDYVDKQGDMDTLFEKLRYNMERLPYFLIPMGYNRKKHSTYMRLLNPELNCAIIGEATNRDFGRGGRKKSMFYDEFQSWESAEEAWRSGSDATQCKIALGTPEGSGNKFAELSRTDEVKRKIRLIWYLHPEKSFTSDKHLLRVNNHEIVDRLNGYTVVVSEWGEPEGCYVDQYGKIRSEWYDLECEKRDPDDIRQNLDCDYLTSGRPVFDTLKCDKNLRDCVEPKWVGNLVWDVAPKYDEFGTVINSKLLKVRFEENFNGIWKIWEKPVDGWDNGYLVDADTAEGLEQGDFDSADVWLRFDGVRLVASLFTHLKTFEYAEELAKAGVYYGNAFVVPERTGMGLSVVDQLFSIYPKIYFKEVMTKGYPERTDKLGWDTNKGTKPQVITNLSYMISNDEFKSNDETFWRQTLTFVNDNGKLEAQGKSKGERCFDDKVMSHAIGLWVHGQLPAAIRKREEVKYTGWRASWNKDRRERTMVGWVV